MVIRSGAPEDILHFSKPAFNERTEQETSLLSTPTQSFVFFQPSILTYCLRTFTTDNRYLLLMLTFLYQPNTPL